MTNTRSAPPRPSPGMGAAPVLTILVVLLMAALASLALSAALSDASMSDRSVVAITNFYETNSRATEILGEIDASILGINRNGMSDAAYERAASEALTAIDGVRVLSEQDGLHVLYDVPGSKGYILSVELALLPSGSADRFRVLTWTYLPTDSWEIDDSLPVWDGE